MSRTQRLAVVLALNLALVASLIAVGITAHSLAVFAEGGDYLLDAAGVGVAMLAIRLSSRATGPAGRTRVTSLAALVNAGWLLVLELLVAAGAADRLATHTPAVAGLPVLIVSGIAALAMTAGALVLRGDAEPGAGDETANGARDETADETVGGTGDRTENQAAGGAGDQAGDRDLSVAAVLLDTVADAAAAAGVAVTGGIIFISGGWYWLDPAVALAIAVVVTYHALALIRKAAGRLRPAAADGNR